MAKLKQLDRAVQSTNTWLKEIGRGLGVSPTAAWHVLAAVLHTLRDRMSVDEARHFGAQLPLVIRGLFFDQWGPAHRLPRIHTRAQFAARVKSRLKTEEMEPEEAIAVIFGVLLRHPTGEIQKVLKTLPPSFRPLVQAAPRVSAASPFEWE